MTRPVWHRYGFVCGIRPAPDGGFIAALAVPCVHRWAARPPLSAVPRLDGASVILERIEPDEDRARRWACAMADRAWIADRRPRMGRRWRMLCQNRDD